MTRGKCKIALAVEMDVPGYEPLRYRLQMEPRGPSITGDAVAANHPRPFYIDAHHGRVEYLTHRDRAPGRPRTGTGRETALSQVPRCFVSRRPCAAFWRP